MREWSICPLILIILTNIFNASCEKGSLTYVIDDTYSMYNDIAQVQQSTDDVTKIVFQEKASLIKNMLLVTVNDPDVRLIANTEDRNYFKRSIYSISVNGGGDCPEQTMEGILLALQSSLPNSFIYVFTDASTHRHWKSREIMNLCQKKQSQITFVLTGYCHSLNSKDFRVYYDIAAACSGLAFYVKKDDVKKVLKPIEETIRGNKTVIATAKVPAYKYRNIPFAIDDQTEYAIVTASGEDVVLSVSGPRAEQERILWLANAKSIKLSNPTPGTYTARVMGHTETSVHIVGRTDFLFNHGFSALEPKTLKDTTPQPIADAKTHLSIIVTDPRHTVNIKRAEILDMNERILNILPLRQVGKDFYTTQTFVAPSKRFKVAVIGEAVRDGKQVRRIAKIPVTPQEPPIVLPKSKKPVITISEGSLVKVEYGKTVKLTCEVSAYPKPTISWKNSRGNILASQSSVKELPFDYLSYLTINDATIDDKYSCYAENNQGSSQKTIEFIVKEPFDVKSVIKEKTVLQYGKKATLICDISSSVPMHIYWSHKDPKTGNSKLLVTSDKYEISADHKTLLIHKMDLDLVGTYTCKASLDRDANKVAIFSTQVDIDGLNKPTVSGLSKVIATKGANVAIQCSISGAPQPSISWQFARTDASEFVSVQGADAVLRISAVDEKHAGRYKCVAHNVAGTTEHVTTLIVQTPPKIISSTSVIYNSVEDKDAQLTIPCIARGLPKPHIIWKVNGVTIHTNDKYLIQDEALVIKNPKVSDSHTYTCEASNNVGSVHGLFRVNVFQMPSVSGKSTETATAGSVANIECRIVRGVPKPTISWQYKGSDMIEFVPVQGSDAVLRISSVDTKQAGRYKCVARNIVGTSEHVTTLIVQVTPEIISDTSVIYRSVEDKDAQLTIPCVAKGLPKPHIIWKVNGVTIQTNEKYLIQDGALVIKKPKVSDSQTYSCGASNNAGSVLARFRANVLQMPSVSGKTTETAKAGSVANIECRIIKGVPKPKISWQFMGKDASEFEPVRGYSDAVLRISAVNAKHAGRYKCVANNDVGASEHETDLIVHFAPIITSKQTTYIGLEGDIALRIPCDTLGVPAPVIAWKVNGTAIKPNTRYSIIDGALLIKYPKMNDSGSYTCMAENALGTAEATFDATVNENLEDYGTIKEVHILKDTSKKLECGSGDPNQSVRWFMEEVDLENNKTYLDLENVDLSNDGNYTCRVSDMNGSYSLTYRVIVGYAPEFDFGQTNTVVDWNGSDEGDGRLDCQFSAKPTAEVVWTYNGKVLSSQHSFFLPVSGNWGHYSCNVTNVHGSVQKNFDVISTNCLIKRKPKEGMAMPFILTPELTWPVLESTKNYLTVASGQELIFACPNHPHQKGPVLKEMLATCDKQDTFVVNGKNYKVSDLQCTREIKPLVLKKHEKCLTETSDVIRVGYDFHGFLETYEVCFDTSKNMPLFTRVLMSKSNLGEDVTHSWSKYPGIGDGRPSGGYNCTDAKSTCCYSKTQLVNARDFSDGPAQRSTYIDPLNAVPYWRPCDEVKDPWGTIESSVRSQLSDYSQFIAWSGVHKLEEKNGQTIPRYLWKVLRFDEEETKAVVYVNGPSPTNDDVLCKNTRQCNDVPWLKVDKDHIYCCEVDEFLQAFGLRGTDIGESMEGALGKISSKKI